MWGGFWARWGKVVDPFLKSVMPRLCPLQKRSRKTPKTLQQESRIPLCCSRLFSGRQDIQASRPLDHSCLTAAPCVSSRSKVNDCHHQSASSPEGVREGKKKKKKSERKDISCKHYTWPAALPQRRSTDAGLRWERKHVFSCCVDQLLPIHKSPLVGRPRKKARTATRVNSACPGSHGSRFPMSCGTWFHPKTCSGKPFFYWLLLEVLFLKAPIFKPRKNAKNSEFREHIRHAEHRKIQREQTPSTRILKSPHPEVLPARRCHFFSRSLSSLSPLCLVSTSAFSQPSHPPSRRGTEREREYQIQTLSSSSSSSSSPAPRAQNNSSNPERVPESYWTRFCVCVCVAQHVDVCAASGPDQDTLFMLPPPPLLLLLLLAAVPPLNCQEMLKRAI